MSKIGQKPVAIKENVTVSKEADKVVVHGPLGELAILIPSVLEVKVEAGQVVITRLNDEKKTKAMHGTINRLISNAIEGVSSGFSRVLEIVGTGYRAQMEGTDLVLSLGFSHPVKFPTPPGVKIETLEGNKINVFGSNKEVVGVAADKIRSLRKPDPYKGKGIRYSGEQLKLKPGKAAAKGGAAGAKQ